MSLTAEQEKLVEDINLGKIRHVASKSLENYYIDKKGRIYSLSKDRQNIKRIASTPSSDGYRVVVLESISGWKKYRLHDLVLESFDIPRPDLDSLPIPKNNDLKDLSLENLRWGNREEFQKIIIINLSEKKEIVVHSKDNAKLYGRGSELLDLANKRINLLSEESLRYRLSSLLEALEPFIVLEFKEEGAGLSLFDDALGTVVYQRDVCRLQEYVRRICGDINNES